MLRKIYLLAASASILLLATPASAHYASTATPKPLPRGPRNRHAAAAVFWEATAPARDDARSSLAPGARSWASAWSSLPAMPSLPPLAPLRLRSLMRRRRAESTLGAVTDAFNACGSKLAFTLVISLPMLCAAVGTMHMSLCITASSRSLASLDRCRRRRRRGRQQRAHRSPLARVRGLAHRAAQLRRLDAAGGVLWTRCYQTNQAPTMRPCSSPCSLFALCLMASAGLMTRPADCRRF